MDSTAFPGLPSPPPLGASALPAGTYDGSLVLVTGGGTGLGRAIAAEFARLGADLLIVSRRERHLAPARAELAKLGTRVTSAVCDIRDPKRISEVFDGCALPDVLVNNAAANFPVPTEDLSPNAWQAVVDITLTGTFLMTREFGRRHLAAGTPGSVIDVGASYAWTGGPGFAHSAAAKAGVESLVRTLAVEWGPYGIQVNGLVPGLMPHEDMTDDIRGNLARAAADADSGDGPDGSPDNENGENGPDGDQDNENGGQRDALGRRQPALRVGAPRELGWAATFLASPYARFITGHTLVVDGANWQRRGLVSPPVTPVRDQLGRGPFTG
ncbi:SDR family oxidoreductase [Streptomyces rhizosphaerihabitans]|uniref:SDR family oxidoreductase n=1 Tax=Streptomyces rhizosphaerihabitans TaxID=1266770 RepID=UPI0021BF1D0E|nr:SDR family oxidoreductase [Streptomyces rhizosphaerihabitans]MCT9010857.1 SDR family oxidoreductase [Streptomyces rhizosphaerihabitans]